MFEKIFNLLLIVLLLVAAVTGCSNSSGGENSLGKTGPGYTIGGTVTGLDGSGLVLQNNGGDSLAVSSNGDFTFPNPVQSGGTYNVIVMTQPTSPSQTCAVADGNGEVAARNITTVTITCTTNDFMVGGTVAGLTGSGLILTNNGGDNLSISGNGAFTFGSPVTSGSSYDIAIATQPDSPAQTCVVSEGTGVVEDQDVTSVIVSCTAYNVGVMVTGLGVGGTLILQNNGGDDLEVTENGGPFVFDTPVYDLLPYSVTIVEQPGTSYEQCMVANGNGSVTSADMLEITVVCPSVTALYPANGANWNDYVNNNGDNGFTADDTACNGSGTSYASCLHGGEMRVATITGLTDCSGITAEDELSAFNWACDDSTGVAKVVSTSLKKNAALSSLIDFSNAQWLDNSVIIHRSGSPVARTPADTWWSNALNVANAGGPLASGGVIYLITADASANYTVEADRVGFVVQPDVELTGGSLASNVSADTGNYLWIEGRINADGNVHGISWDNVAFSVMKNVRVRNAEGDNVFVLNSANNALKNVHVSGSILHGLSLENSHDNAVIDAVAINNKNSGIFMTASSGNKLIGTITANNDSASNVEGSGILVVDSPDNTFINLTIANNRLSGLTFGNSPNNLIKNVAAVNNYTSLLILDGSNNNTVENVVLTNNERRGVLLRDVNNNYFTGLLKVGNNPGRNCGVQGSGNAPGLINVICSDSGANGSSGYTGQGSDATLKTNVTSASSFVGKVLTDDQANASDLNGSAVYTGITDWENFDNEYRGWGLDGDPFPSFSNKGPLPYCENYSSNDETECIANGGIWRSDGRIWDWSAASGDTGDNGAAVLKQVLSTPTGDDTITHNWSASGSSTYLRNAVEIQGDAIGNDDGLCNSNESCVFTPNIGVYQGHGTLSSTAFVDSTGGGITGVMLYQYEANSY